jgi:MFS family permease
MRKSNDTLNDGLMSSVDFAQKNAAAAVPKSKPPLWRGIPVGVCYAASMGVCGNVLVGIGDALVEIVDKVGVDPKDTGSYFVTRGVGQILATLYCAELYSSFYGNGILVYCLALVTVLWICVAFITNQWVLYLWFFATGLLTATTDIGTQILTRRAYGANAGPWLTANTFCFATAGLVAPLVDYATPTLLAQCSVYGTFAALSSALMLVCGEDCYLIPTRKPTQASDQPPVSVGAKIRQSLTSWCGAPWRSAVSMCTSPFP